MKCRFILRTFLTIMPVCVILRTVQLLFFTDNRTGFLKPQYMRLNLLLMAVMAVAALLLAGVTITVRRCPTKTPKVKAPLAVASFVFGTAVFADAIANFARGSLSILPLVVAFVGGLSAIFLFIYAAKAFLKINVPSLFYGIPTVFCIVKLVVNFTSLLSLTSIIENALFVLSLCLATVFFLEFAKVANEVVGNNTHKILMVSGALAAVACMTFSLPQLVIFLIDTKAKLHHNVFTLILMLTMGIFISFYLFRHFSNGNMRKHKHSKSHSRQSSAFMKTKNDNVAFYLGE